MVLVGPVHGYLAPWAQAEHHGGRNCGEGALLLHGSWGMRELDKNRPGMNAH